MTYEEIIKALESKKEDMICAVVDKNRKTRFITNEVVLDLINNQQAEIERLQKDSKRLKKVQMQLDDAMKMHDVIKSEAIKEFAERFEAYIPMVRCKDCKHFMEYTEEYAKIVGEADGDCYIRQMNTYYNEKFCGVKLNDYCSYGERRCEK